MDEWDNIPLSRLSHAGYCLRRAALLTNEHIWTENADTAKGRAEHEKVHSARVERRRNEIKLYEYHVLSKELGISGQCDCVEATAYDQGCRIPAVDFPVQLYPIEFKHGKIRQEIEYNIQLCAQAMCLEEMYHTHISEGAIFYISSHHRYTVVLDEALRQKVRETIAACERIRRTYSIPPAEYGAKCNRCSLRDDCLPELPSSAADYCSQLERDAKKVDAL